MFGHSLAPLALTAALGLSLCATAHAQSEPYGSHQPRFAGSLGARVSRVPNAGFDPFADSDDLAQVSIGLGARVLRFQRLSLAAVGYWDYGQRNSRARGAETALGVHRLSIGPELRYQILPPLYVFAQALPAFGHSGATLKDGVTASTLEANHWAYGVDVSAGVAVEPYGNRNGDSRRPRFWVIAQGGYGYLSPTKLRLTPESGGGAPERTVPLDLGSLSLSGPFLRISAAVSF